MTSRVNGAQSVVAEAEALHRAGGEVVHDDVRPRDEALGDGQPLGPGDVDHERALIGADLGVVTAALGVGYPVLVGADEAQRVHARAALDVDDVGAVVGQGLRRHRPNDHPTEIGDLDAGERQRRGGAPGDIGVTGGRGSGEGVLELGEDLVLMLAEEGGAASQRGWSLCRFGERAGVADGTAPLLVLQVAPEVAGGELDVAQGLVGTGAGVEIKAVVVGGRVELRLGELGEDRGGSLTVGIPVRRGQGAGIGRLPVQREQGVRLAGRFEPGDEARVALKGQGAQVEGVEDVAVAAAPGPGQPGDAGPLRAADVATEHVPSGRDLKGRTGDGVADCYVDVLAAARPLPLRERQQGGDGGVAARAEARLGVVAEVGGRALRLPRDRHQAAHRPGDDVGPFVGGVRAVLPERRDRDEHQPWVELRQPLVAEAEPVHLPRRG